jgi:hypothetical protein
MALFSDVDWLILLGAAGLLFLGPNNRELFRKIGRYYGRLLKAKQDLLAEFSRAADLPAPSGLGSMSFRASLLGWEEDSARQLAVPLAPPSPTFLPPASVGTITCVNSLGPVQWSSVAAYAPDSEGRGG